MADVGVCDNILSYYPINHFIPGSPSTIGIFMVLMGIIFIVMSLLTIIFIKSQELKQYDSNEVVTSQIFPVFVYVLWLSVLVGIVSGIVVTMIPFHPEGGNTVLSSVLYAAVKGFQHMLIEGIAFLLMQKGCGKYAAKQTFLWSLKWGIFIFLCRFFIYWKEGLIGDSIEIVMDVIIFLFYSVLWLAPEKILFRRPAVYLYARFWVYFRLATIVLRSLYFFKTTESVAACGYLLSTMLLFAIFQPLICYWTLKQDSAWWQGMNIYQGGRRLDHEDIKTPLLGIDISLESAQSLADTMDTMKSKNHVHLINFAKISLNASKFLGTGSFSKVYRGQYEKQECAIKMIYTVDLTTDVIRRIASEASILSSIKHPNVVHIFGVAVLPPSVCLVLELCQFGSLSDIIRGQSNLANPGRRFETMLSYADQLHLALGCAKGVAAIHSYDSKLCHRDIKSFNFLVDKRFVVKIADLELGIDTEEALISSDNNNVSIDDLLPNWMAPELFLGNPYTQASDVYSLGLVLWEIISKKVPYDDEYINTVIRNKIISGYKHPIPSEYADSCYGALIMKSLDMNPVLRPSSHDIATELQRLLNNVCSKPAIMADEYVNLRPLYEYYNKLYVDKRSSWSTRHSMIDVFSSQNKSFIGAMDNRESSQHSLRFLVHDDSIAVSSTIDDESLLLSPQRTSSNMNLPMEIKEILQRIRSQNWSSFDKSDLSWAICTASSPHIIVHTTKSFDRLFGLDDFNDCNLRLLKDFILDMKDYRQVVNAAYAPEATPSEPIAYQTDKIIDSRKTGWLFWNKLFGVSQSTCPSQFVRPPLSISNRIHDSCEDNYDNFMIQLRHHNQAHSVLPMIRSIDDNREYILCSAHGYTLHGIKNNEQKHTPLYQAILFHELKDVEDSQVNAIKPDEKGGFFELFKRPLDNFKSFVSISSSNSKSESFSSANKEMKLPIPSNDMDGYRLSEI